MQILRNYAPIAALCGPIFLAVPAFAQTQCLEGKTASGACVDATLGSMMRQGVRVFTQPRLSNSGPAVAPSSDRRYDVLRDWGHGLNREAFGPCTALAGPFCP